MPRIGRMPPVPVEMPVGAYGWDGTVWQRVQVDASKFLKIILQAGTAIIGKLAANDGVDIGDVGIKDIAGVSPQMDDTDKQAVGLHGKVTAAGDTPLMVSPEGRIPIVFASSAVLTDGRTNTAQVPTTEADAAGAAWAIYSYRFNGANWDRQRSNIEAILLASAARTVTINSSDQVNYNARGIIMTLEVTSITDTPSIVLKIQHKDGVSAVYESLLVAAAVTAVGIHTYILYPGVGVAADDVVEVNSFPLGRTWRLRVEHADTDSITYSVGASYIL